MTLNQFKHDLAKLRQRGKGVWIITYVVIGYDETFVMHAPGDTTQHFAERTTMLTLAHKLGVKRKFVIHDSTVMETP